MDDGNHWYSDTFAPLIELWKWIKSLVPTSFRLTRPRFNFITNHYLYIIGFTILVSIILYPARNMPYVDALFFAAGTATQSGLNTIDVNKLETYQQVTFMIACCLCTPIYINTVVVFVRLYWFEKRFAHIIQESRARRRERTLSWARSKSKTADHNSDDPVRLEMGVRGKPIQVLRNTSVTTPVARGTEHSTGDTEKDVLNTTETNIDPNSSGSHSISSEDHTESSEMTMAHPSPPGADEKSHLSEKQPLDDLAREESQRLNRGITFADEVTGNHSPEEIARVPEQRDLSKHVDFLERQQANARKGGAYRIPGPREMDEGHGVEQLDQDETLRRQISRTASGLDSMRRRSIDGPIEQSKLGDEHVMFQEPEHPGHRDRSGDNASELTRRRSHRGPNFFDRPRSFARTLTNLTRMRSGDDPMPYLSWTATTGRNSAFFGLTADQRDELGGVEYRALKLLAKVLICYFVGIHLLAMVVLLPWIASSEKYSNIIREDGQDPLWWGVFTPASLFNDLGFTLTPDSMISFQDATLPLLFGSFLIVVGNTGFPCFLRFIIWVLSRFESLRRDGDGQPTELYKDLRFLLDHPRRCFTLLFPSKATWWLFWVLLLLNGIDLIFFIILDLNKAAVEDLSDGHKVLNGWFQAVSTRTAGFASVNLADLHAAIQVSYLVMMYISVFPIAISVRRTNVYEEKSLGLFGGEEEGEGEQSYVSQHLRRQLSFDLWYIFLGLFIITIVEGDRVSNSNEPAFTTFSILFEIVSAYGTVGLSLGYPNVNASFSAEFRTLSKLIIIAMMIRGRHRGLPYALDRAILLPSEKLAEKEAEMGEQMARRNSVFTEANGEIGRSTTLEDVDRDQNGLPRHYTTRSMPILTGEEPDTTLRPQTTRLSAAVSTRTQGHSPSKQHRSRSLSRVIAGGLSAGPTTMKRD